MKIILKNIGKRFNKEWVFRNINYEFSDNNKYAILGINGSGKSTLLQIIAGAISESEGEVKYEMQNVKSGNNCLFKNISYAAPYLKLPEEMTWKECVLFHGKFKKFISGLDAKDVISASELETYANKEIKNFSSGMKQRAKLSLAILSDSPLLFLDEPVTHLDKNAVRWFQNLIARFTKDRLVVVCSNYNNEEYAFCKHSLVMPMK